ncbi:MBL fold metallo-hydrolase [Leptothoe sp. EHU-05/26/07-4]
MHNQPVYLKQNVMVEPLFNQWYAWSYLIAPACAAMYVENSHLKTLSSFVTSPQVHVAALKNPKMVGGPFINYDVDRVADIQILLDKTLQNIPHLRKLAQAIKALRNLLKKAEGYSLEPLYPEIPDALRGYVELVYDSENRPSFRLIEGLLYQSRYYNLSCQSIALSLIHGNNRPFALSTPRLRDEHTLHVPIPFHSSLWDDFFQMRHQPAPAQEIQKKLNIPIAEESLFASFFTEEPPPVRTSLMDGVRIRYLGHACLLIEVQGTTILCDPLLSYRHEAGLDRYTFADLPDTLDYILITHNHQDHCMLETLLQLRYKTQTVIVPKSSGGELIDPSLKLILQTIGFKQVRELDVLETIEFEGGFIQGLPFLGEHGDLNILTKTAYHIRAHEQSILVAADSNNIEPRLYEHLKEIIDADILFLGMECDGAPFSWIYNPLITRPIPRKMDQSRRLDGSNYERAIGIIECLQPQQVYVYAMGQEPWLSFIMATQYTQDSRPIVESNRLIQACCDRDIIAERLCGQKEIIITS